MSIATYASQTETLAVRMAREAIILHPTKGYIPFRARDYQRDFWNDSSPLRIICKARQIGFSQAVGAEVIERALKSVCRILIISREENLAIQVLDYCKGIYRSLPHPEAIVVGENTKRLAFSNGSEVISLTASARAGRGYPATHVYMDEAAFIQWANTIFQSIAPTVSTGGTLTILSSPDGPDNLFGNIWEGKRGPVKDYDGTPAPRGIWSRHFVPWTRNPAYTTEDPDWFANNRQRYTESEWASEFEASLATSGDRVFRPEYLDLMVDGWVGGGEWIDDDLWYTPPLPDRLYMSGWDLGRKRDHTVGVTVDVTDDEHQVVAFERFLHMPWDEQQERITARYFHYPGWTVMDATGVGDPIWLDLTQAGFDIIPFVFSRVSKPNAVNELKRSTEFKKIKCGIAQVYSEMHRYQWKDENLTQDTVMALAMAEYQSRHLDLLQTYEEDERVSVSGSFRGL